MSWVICWKHPLLTVSKCLKSERASQEQRGGTEILAQDPTQSLQIEALSCSRLWAAATLFSPLVTGSSLSCSAEFLVYHHFGTGMSLFQISVPCSCYSLSKPLATTCAPRRWPYTSRCSIWVGSVKLHQNNNLSVREDWNGHVLASFPNAGNFVPQQEQRQNKNKWGRRIVGHPPCLTCIRGIIQPAMFSLMWLLSRCFE